MTEKNNNNDFDWGIRGYQELIQQSTQTTLQIWTEVLNFWWGKK